MRTLRLVSGSIFVYLVVAGTSTATADTTTGTRLKAQWYVGADGSRALAGWYDSQLKVTCTFLTASDGTVRCLPQFGASAAQAVDSAYADAKCTQPVALGNSGCALSYVIGASDNACTAQQTYAIYQIGPALSTVYVLDATGTTCSASAASTASMLVYFAIGPAVSPSTFEPATVQTDP